MYKDKYLKYKNKYLNLLNNTKNMKGGKVCTSSDEVFKSEISKLYKNLLGSVRSFFIISNSSLFRSSRTYFFRGNEIHVSKNIMKQMLSELEADYSRDASFSAKKAMIINIITNFKNLKNCLNKEFSDEDLLVAVNFADNVNGRKLGTPMVKFKTIEDVTVEYYEKLLWWGCNINCHSIGPSTLFPGPPIPGPRHIPPTSAPMSLPRLKRDCWKMIASSRDEFKYSKLVKKYNIEIENTYSTTKMIGTVQRQENLYCSRNYPYNLFLETKDFDLRKRSYTLSRLIYRDMHYLKKYGENVCSIFPKPSRGMSAKAVFNDGLKGECKDLGGLSPYSLSPTDSSIPSFIPRNIFTVSPDSPSNNFLILPNSTHVFANDFRPRSSDHPDGFVPDYSNKTFNQESEDSIDIDWEDFDRKMNIDSTEESSVKKPKKKISKKSKKKTSKKSKKKTSKKSKKKTSKKSKKKTSKKSKKKTSKKSKKKTKKKTSKKSKKK